MRLPLDVLFAKFPFDSINVTKMAELVGLVDRTMVKLFLDLEREERVKQTALMTDVYMCACFDFEDYFKILEYHDPAKRFKKNYNTLTEHIQQGLQGLAKHNWERGISNENMTEYLFSLYMNSFAELWPRHKFVELDFSGIS